MGPVIGSVAQDAAFSCAIERGDVQRGHGFCHCERFPCYLACSSIADSGHADVQGATRCYLLQCHIGISAAWEAMGLGSSLAGRDAPFWHSLRYLELLGVCQGFRVRRLLPLKPCRCFCSGARVTSRALTGLRVHAQLVAWYWSGSGTGGLLAQQGPRRFVVPALRGSAAGIGRALPSAAGDVSPQRAALAAEVVDAMGGFSSEKERALLTRRWLTPLMEGFRSLRGPPGGTSVVPSASAMGARLSNEPLHALQRIGGRLTRGLLDELGAPICRQPTDLQRLWPVACRTWAQWVQPLPLEPRAQYSPVWVSHDLAIPGAGSVRKVGQHLRHQWEVLRSRGQA